jgi:hypothetical protein
MDGGRAARCVVAKIRSGEDETLVIPLELRWQPQGQLPHPAAFLAFLGNWQLMVAATMLPTAIPAMAARARRTDRWWAATSAVVAATCAVWTGFAVAVLAGDCLVHRLVAEWSWLAKREWLVPSAVLVLADAVHLAPLKRRARRGTQHVQPAVAVRDFLPRKLLGADAGDVRRRPREPALDGCARHGDDRGARHQGMVRDWPHWWGAR